MEPDTALDRALGHWLAHEIASRGPAALRWWEERVRPYVLRVDTDRDALARLDRAVDAYLHARAALRDGRAAFHRGDFAAAVDHLRVATAHEVGDSAPYLAETYRRLGRAELAAAWKVIAVAEGFEPGNPDEWPSGPPT